MSLNAAADASRPARERRTLGVPSTGPRDPRLFTECMRNPYRLLRARTQSPPRISAVTPVPSQGVPRCFGS